MATTATSVGSLASLQKKSKSLICGLLKVSRKGSEDFFIFIVERIYRCIGPKAKNKVGNHPSHDATLNADLHVAKP